MFEQMTRLRSLDLSNNEFSGMILKYCVSIDRSKKVQKERRDFFPELEQSL